MTKVKTRANRMEAGPTMGPTNETTKEMVWEAAMMMIAVPAATAVMGAVVMLAAVKMAAAKTKAGRYSSRSGASWDPSSRRSRATAAQRMGADDA